MRERERERGKIEEKNKRETGRQRQRRRKKLIKSKWAGKKRIYCSRLMVVWILC